MRTRAIIAAMVGVIAFFSAVAMGFDYIECRQAAAGMDFTWGLGGCDIDVESHLVPLD
jgi:hypothetical protein